MMFSTCLSALVNSVVVNNNNKRMYQDSDSDWKPDALYKRGRYDYSTTGSGA